MHARSVSVPFETLRPNNDIKADSTPVKINITSATLTVILFATLIVLYLPKIEPSCFEIRYRDTIH